VQAGNRTRWTLSDITIPLFEFLPGMYVDATEGISMMKDGEVKPMTMGIQDYGISGKQFNLIGYSYGSVVAAQIAIKYVRHFGGSVDHLVLLGSPISQEFLDELKAEPGIRKLVILDLTAKGDPIYAGMSTLDLFAAGPALMNQKSESSGHFWYAGEDGEGKRRRRALAESLYELGMR
jgi:pimeloyl-ACP methyl ester carboxylesterase